MLNAYDMRRILQIRGIVVKYVKYLLKVRVKYFLNKLKYPLEIVHIDVHALVIFKLICLFYPVK